MPNARQWIIFNKIIKVIDSCRDYQDVVLIRTWLLKLASQCHEDLYAELKSQLNFKRDSIRVLQDKGIIR